MMRGRGREGGRDRMTRTAEKKEDDTTTNTDIHTLNHAHTYTHTLADISYLLRASC